MGLFSFLLTVLVILIVCITYRVHNPALRWFFIILPPLSLILLYWIPQNSAGMLYWIPASIAFLWSAISILVNTIIIVKKEIKHESLPALLKIKFIRPSLTIVICLTAIIAERQSLASADKYAIETAKNIQAIAKTSHNIPEKIDGWNEHTWDSNDCRIMYGKYGTKYPITYEYSSDKKEFTIWVRHSIDITFYIYGGVEIPLNAQLSIDDRTIDVPIKEK